MEKSVKMAAVFVLEIVEIMERLYVVTMAEHTETNVK